MPRSSAAVVLAVAAIALAGCQQAGEDESAAFPEVRTVPLLQPHEPYAPERDDPPALVAELVRRQREGLTLLRRARAAPADEAGGCVHASPTLAGPPQPKEWLPAPPEISARLLGVQVEVDVELHGSPTSLACRPIGFTIVVSDASTSNGGIASYQLFGPGVSTAPRRFRVLGRLPYGGSPPYKVTVSVESMLGRRSPYVERALTCPSRGCLRGPTVEDMRVKLPPAAPLQGVSAGALERSVHAAFAFETDRSVGPATCKGTTCSIPFTDGLRGARGVMRYRIRGEQVAGCWLGTAIAEQVTPPGAETGLEQMIGGCVSWR